jgi:hypothetical protein
LCFEHVDNLGAYSIPSETGLLIPSDCAHYFRLARYSAKPSMSRNQKSPASGAFEYDRS